MSDNGGYGMSDTLKTLEPALRQFQHNDCSGLVFGFDHDKIVRIVSGLEKENAELEAAKQTLSAALLATSDYINDDLMASECRDLANSFIKGE